MFHINKERLTTPNWAGILLDEEYFQRSIYRFEMLLDVLENDLGEHSMPPFNKENNSYDVRESIKHFLISNLPQRFKELKNSNDSFYEYYIESGRIRMVFEGSNDEPNIISINLFLNVV